MGRLSSIPRPMAREAPTAERKLSAVECNNCYLLPFMRAVRDIINEYIVDRLEKILVVQVGIVITPSTAC